MLEDAKTVTEGEPTFADIIDVFIEDMGFDAVQPFFTRLEGLYLQINPDYKATLDLAKFRELSFDERVELEGAQAVADTVVTSQYTEKKDEQIEDENEDVRRSMQTINQPPLTSEEETETDYKRVNNGAGIFAYLSRAYDFEVGDGAYDRE